MSCCLPRRPRFSGVANVCRFAGFQLGGPCSASGVVGTWTTSTHNVGAFRDSTFRSGTRLTDIITQMIHAVRKLLKDFKCHISTDCLYRTIMDVEGFGPGEVALLSVARCMCRSAGSTYPGAVLLGGNVVREWWIYGGTAGRPLTRC